MTDTPQGAWMREYERLRDDYADEIDVFAELTPSVVAARAALDAHVRGLVEECERLLEALGEIAGLHAHHAVWLDGCSMANDMGHIAINALTTPKDAP